ncbi:MAG: hypothetical protein SGPRY_006654 [Prymnesium sp.]
MGGDVEMLTYASLGWMARVRAGGKKAERWEGRLIHAFSDLNADGRGGGEARGGEGGEGGDEGEAAPPLPMLCDLASAERLLTAIPLSAVDFHISRVLDTALSQPYVHQSLVSLLSSHPHLSPSLPPSDTEGRVRVLAQSAMLHCSSSISSKTLQLSGDTIINLSLAGEAHMVYTHDRDRRAAVRVRLPRRSLQIQTGEVRYNFRHGIENQDLPELRVSVTFRRARIPE